MARRLWSPVVLWVAGVTLEAQPNPALDFENNPTSSSANHQGYFDIPAAFATIQQPIRFVAKRSLAYVPILGWYMVLTGHVFIERGNRQQSIDSLRRAGERIGRGTSIPDLPGGHPLGRRDRRGAGLQEGRLHGRARRAGADRPGGGGRFASHSSTRTSSPFAPASCGSRWATPSPREGSPPPTGRR